MPNATLNDSNALTTPPTNGEVAPDPPKTPRLREREVRLEIPENGDQPGSGSYHDIKERDSGGKENDDASSTTTAPKKSSFTLPQQLAWIPANWTWSKIKVAIRCAIAAWISLVLFVIPSVESAMGQASFLILIASFLSPPSDPFVAVMERETLIISFNALAWAWSCLAMKLADLARTNRDTSVTYIDAISGDYIQLAPTVIMAVFIFFGSAFFLYVKARQGPGPYTFACIFGCIAVDISLTTGVFFPYPYYKLGQVIIVPLAMHSAVAIICSVLVFPSTVSAQFTTRCQAVLTPLVTSLGHHRKILKTDTQDEAFNPAAILASVNASESALVPLAASARLLRTDIIYSRFAPTDFAHIHNMLRRLAVRANGMTIYFTLIDPTRERFPITPAPSRPGTPMTSQPGTPRPSRPHSPARGEKDAGRPSMLASPRASYVSTRESAPNSASATHRRSMHVHGLDTPTRSRSRPRSHLGSPHSHFGGFFPPHHNGHAHAKSPHAHHHMLHTSLLHLAMSREQPVGVFESQRYLQFEADHRMGEDSVLFTARATALLQESCDELLGHCGSALESIQEWLVHVRDGRLKFWKGKERERATQARITKYEDLRAEMLTVLETFRSDKRLLVLDPYRSVFDPKHASLSAEGETAPPHRYLFHCYVYQYHLMSFGLRVIDTLSEIIRLEKERKRNRIWTPVDGVGKIFSWSTWDATDNLEHDDEENPEIIPGMEPGWVDDLGMPRRRDPDALPPNNAFEAVMNFIYNATKGLGSGNALFAIKAGVLSILLSLPSLIRSSAPFAYNNKFVWATFMGQLTIARFRGDTTFGLVSRIISTSLGGLVGMTLWYISTGNGRGSPYGIAAVYGVCFPFFFYARLYWPGPPMTNLVFFVTSILVVGYSYQDQHIFLPSSPGSGFSVAWRRFVLVTAGVTAAFIFSFLPPSTTIRRYQRTSLSTVCTEVGNIYCSILSFANSSRKQDNTEIVQSLIAIRSKLKRSLTLKANVIYEFSLRGRWPADRYHKILEIQLQIAYSLSHLMSVVEHLNPAWTQAFMRRTRFMDSDFQGDVLAVISMISTSLRTGTPLPQITPCPLVDRFMIRHQGLDVIEQESEDDYGLPRTMTMSTLENEQYMVFCVGVSTAFGIMSRLDRLMVAVKELVGEQYHIRGVGLRTPRHEGAGVEMGSRTNSLRPQDV
ncbi:hypothetical protein PLICRDRAFT_179954 [Plicaturopsis crispa FD-325 SS-3]|uniref:ER transporter 6TM N-terminal domain-containing protein n=1 Tax=Plicaturopsis crispa FD-325 SS-3 TaxID=944288 RepID=A0A0C9SWT4_PLICR|nr:hypothetical protein PLICRDRAFT_179954 [Plicaturopsis crispa FD-325 SS-3]